MHVLIGFGDELSDHALDHVGGPNFARVLPGHDDDHFLLLLLGLPADGDFGDVVAADGSADRLDAELEGFEGVVLSNELGLLEEGDHLGVAVGEGHANEDVVILVFEDKVEGESVEFGVGQLLYINWGLLVDNVFGRSTPPFSFGPGVMQREDGGFAAVLEEGVLFFLE